MFEFHAKKKKEDFCNVANIGFSLLRSVNPVVYVRTTADQ